MHLPLAFIGDLTIGRLALAIGAPFVLAVLMRLLVGATVHGAAGSLLAAGLVHASFNAANNEGTWSTTCWAASALAVRGRRRGAVHRRRTPRPAQPALTSVQAGSWTAPAVDHQMM